MIDLLTSSHLPERGAYIREWRHTYHLDVADFEQSRTSFIPNLLPEFASKLDVFQVLDILRKKLGTETLARALNPHETIASPMAQQPDFATGGALAGYGRETFESGG